MSRRQLHETERGATTRRRRRAVVMIREVMPEMASVRSCGMEALDKAQQRTKVKLRKACASWMSVRPNATSVSRSSSTCSGDGVARNLTHLTQGDLWSSAGSGLGRWGGSRNDPSTRLEKSDRLVGAWKPGNAGGAKEATE